MFISILEKINLILKNNIVEKISLILKNNREKLKYECIKICILYLISGFIWIYFSDRAIDLLFSNKNALLIINTYKGWLYVIVTDYILYLLIDNFLKKIYYTKERLKENNKYLKKYVQELTSAKEELKAQYNEIHENQKKLNELEEKRKALIKAIPDLLFTISIKGVVISCEISDEEKLLILKERFIGKSIDEIMPIEIAETVYKKLEIVSNSNTLQSFDYKNKGIYYEVRMVKKSKNEILAIVRDVTVNKKLENKLKYLSYRDKLTDLYNRRFFEEQLKILDVEENLPLTVLLGDVNGLKLINDSFGHVIGDELISKVGKIIKKACRDEDIIARIGGDEFVILMPKTDSDKAKQIIKDINELTLKEKQKI